MTRYTLLRSFFSLFLVIVLSLSGCSVGEFATAYFNTYYNAQRLFGEAEDEVWAMPEARQSGRSYLIQFNISSATKTKLTAVIEKCSKLLQYHAESNLVDDALLMIGKSYFYSDDLPKAERKFKELIDDYPSSGLVIEGRLLLAYTSYKLNEKTAALAQAKEVLALAEKEGDDDVQSRAASLIAQVERESKNYPQAQEMYAQAAEHAETDMQRALALLNSAEMYAQLNNFGDAEKAYRESASTSGEYLGEYRGLIGASRMLTRQGEYQRALDLLSRLRENTNNREFFGEIDLETANVYAAMGDLTSAVGQYRYVDTLYARTEVSAKSYYQLGQVYETKFFRYDSARVAYNKGRGEAPQAAVTPLLGQRADAMNRYAQYAGEIAKYDSLRAILLSPPAPRALDSTHAADSTRAPDSTAHDPSRAQAPPISLDSIQTLLAMNKSELAGLFFTSIGRMDSAIVWYNRVLIEHPASQFVPGALFALAQIYAQDSTGGRSKADSLYGTLIRRYPDSELAVEARRILGLQPLAIKVDEAAQLYNGAATLIEQGKGADALPALREVMSRFPQSRYAPRAQFAIGWVYENVAGLPDSALSAYRTLLRAYPGTSYASAVQRMVATADAEQAAAEQQLLQQQQRAADSTRQAMQILKQKQQAADSTKLAPQLPKQQQQAVDSTKLAPQQPQQPNSEMNDESPRNRPGGRRLPGRTATDPAVPDTSATGGTVR